MFSERRNMRPVAFGGGSSGPPPRDLLVLLGVLFGTFSLQFFQGTAWLPALLRLGHAAWANLFVWQVVTYPLVGFGTPSIWFLLELLILFWFGRDVYRYLGRKGFWQLLAWACVSAGVAAVVVDALAGGMPGAFQLMQGQRMLLAVAIAAFATIYGHATIYLFFVLPIQAKWFIGLELLFAFMGFLGSKDLPGFLGIVVAVAVTYSLLTQGGLRKALRTAWLRARLRIDQARLRRARKQRGMRVVDPRDRRGGGSGDVRRGPWVN